jgi:predicted anti-sigma-YlaC factor YlaD
MAKKKITCKNFLEDLSDYIEGGMERELRVSLEAHLAKCPNCWVVFDETRRTVEILQNVECHPLPQDVHNRLLTALEKSWKSV